MQTLKNLELKLSMTSFGTWLVKKFSSRVDPFLFRMTKGRVTSLGPAVIPQLLLTTTGRKSGQPRDAQLVYTDIDGIPHIVASNFGGERHPAWSHNLAANPEATILLKGKTIAVAAEQLSETEKQAVWERLVDNIPNYALYRKRTDRNFRVYRLVPESDRN